jgi:hypothetical protein
MMAKGSQEGDESLLTLAGPLLVWAGHFLLTYCTAAIYCAKVAHRDDSLGPALVAIAAFSVLALGAVAALWVRGFRLHRAPTPVDDDDAPSERRRFVGFATMLLSGLSAVSIVYVTLTIVIVRSCR